MNTSSSSSENESSDHRNRIFSTSKIVEHASELKERQPLHLMHQTLATYRYENTMIKTELAATLERHSKEIREMQMKYESKIQETYKAKQEVENSMSIVKEQSSLEQRKLHQLNLQCTQKLKFTEDDNESLKSSIEKLKKEKLQLKEQLDHSNNSNECFIFGLKEEKKSLIDQVDALKSELEKEKISSRELTTSLRSEKHQCQLLKNKLNDQEKMCEMKILAGKSEVNQINVVHQKEMDRLTKQLTEVQTNLDDERNEVRKIQEHNYSKTKELETIIGEQKQSNLKNKTEYIQEISKLQQQVKVLESQLNSAAMNKEREITKLNEEICDITEKLYKEQTDKAVLQGRIGVLIDLEDGIKREKEESSNLRQKNFQLSGEMESIVQRNTKLKSLLQEEKNKVTDAHNRLVKHEKEDVNSRDNCDRLVVDLKMRHREEMSELRGRILSLESQLTDKGRHYLDETSTLKQKVKTYGQLIKKLRHRLELGVLREEQLNAHQAALEDNVPQQQFYKVQQQLFDLTRRHAEFAAFIKGMNDCQGKPPMNELNEKVNIISQKLADLEESQIHCFSEMESL